MAQDQQGEGNRPGRGFGRGNFDPAQMQQRMLEDLRDQMEVKEDAEWKALEPLIQKVLDTRRQVESDRFRGMFGRRGRDRGGNGGGEQAGPRRGGMFGQPSPESEALNSFAMSFLARPQSLQSPRVHPPGFRCTTFRMCQ